MEIDPTIEVEIAIKIDEGYAAAQRGELVEADTVRSSLAELKNAHFRKRIRGE